MKPELTDAEIERMVAEMTQQEQSSPILQVITPDEVVDDGKAIGWDGLLKEYDIEKAPTNVFSRLWRRVKNWF